MATYERIKPRRTECHVAWTFLEDLRHTPLGTSALFGTLFFRFFFFFSRHMFSTREVVVQNPKNLTTKYHLCNALLARPRPPKRRSMATSTMRQHCVFFQDVLQKRSFSRDLRKSSFLSSDGFLYVVNSAHAFRILVFPRRGGLA